MKKISIKNFVSEYINRATEDLKNQYIEENLEITQYIPFLTKEVLAKSLIDTSLYEYENYTDTKGNLNKRKTGNLKINSCIHYLLFCRIIIENYTNLTVETESFFEEYDLLNKNGILDKIMQAIPEKEIGELKMIIDMQKDDAIFNYGTPKAYISSQIERFSMLAGTTLKPILETLQQTIATLDESKIEKLGNILERSFKKIK